MKEHHYSATTAADWILHYHFFEKTHTLWFAPAFYTYRMPNPRSSNPLRLYEELYEMWIDRDEHSPKYKDKLISLVNKINKRRDMGLLEDGMASNLKELFATVPPSYMFPFVIRVEGARCPEKRRIMAGSAMSGSSEFLVTDLRHEECELLFTEGELPKPLEKLFRASNDEMIYLDSYQAFDELESALRIYERK